MSIERVAIPADRYSGACSGGKWLAVVCADDLFGDGHSRVEFCFLATDGPSGPDRHAASFWSNPPSWIVAGSSPDDALSILRNR